MLKREVKLDQEPIETTCAREHATLVYGEIQTFLPILIPYNYGQAVLIRSIRSCFSGVLIISLFHKKNSFLKLRQPCSLTSTELHAPSPALSA